MNAEPDRLDPATPARDAVLPRIFLRDPGWRIAVKTDSQREFCYMAAPGQDSYHRLGNGEIYFQRGDEKICLPCADRHGLLEFQPRPLRESIAQPRLEAGDADPIDLA